MKSKERTIWINNDGFTINTNKNFLNIELGVLVWIA